MIYYCFQLKFTTTLPNLSQVLKSMIPVTTESQFVQLQYAEFRTIFIGICIDIFVQLQKEIIPEY